MPVEELQIILSKLAAHDEASSAPADGAQAWRARVCCARQARKVWLPTRTLATYFCRVEMSPMNRGDAAAATWIFRGDESRRRRRCHVDSTRGRRADEGVRSGGEGNG